MKNFEEVEKKIGESYKNKDLLIQAFCHKSYLNENPDFYLENNERLEFLGDAVLEMIITEYLYKNFLEKDEGVMTKLRASLINTKTLAEVAKQLEFQNFILLSKGETRTVDHFKQSMLADLFEAVVGSLFLDRGYSACKRFIKNNLINKLDEIIKNELYKDFKSQLQETIQAKEGITPNYKVIRSWGPDHLRNFIVGVYLNEKLIAEGEGKSKQEAEIDAAQQALKTYGL